MSAWTKYVAWFAARAPRERLILAAATAFAILFVGFNFFVEPAMLRARKASRGIAEATNTIPALERALAELNSSANDPDARLRKEQEHLAATWAEQAQRFAVIERRAVPASAMPALLETMVGRSPGLQLVGLRTLAVEPLLKPRAPADAKDTTPAPPKTNLYRHSVELKVSGNYLALLEYLARLETEAPGLGWSRLSVDTERYPHSVLSVTVQTLSLDSAWLTL